MRVTRMALVSLLLFLFSLSVFGEVAATHIYHNHMPNFWPWYDVTTYDSTNVGAPIRYTYDGQVINNKNNPPANWDFLPDGAPMPHDDLVAYYSHHAKRGAYLSWPMDTANGNRGRFPRSQTHVTMSAAVMTNVNSFAELDNLSGYENDNWGGYWRDVHYNTRTEGGDPALDLIHFTGHHTMGPLTGTAMFEKDLIYHNVTVSQDWFLGSNFKSSKGFFPTELGFSERLIPTLTKLGIEWSVLGNNHYSRTLKDYPYLNDPGVDCVISPPNRADMQNTDTYGGRWVDRQMFNEQQVTQNKFPFASIPHWVQYVDAETAEVHKVAGIPVEQAGSWEEGYQGSVSGGFLKEFEGNTNGRKQYFVVAHDGDNSQGRAGDGGTWANSGNVTYSESGVTGEGVDEYLRYNPIPEDDVMHVQDGSWIDTRDSSSDPQWHHWKLPFCIWKGQFPDMNNAMGTNYSPKNDFNGNPEGMTVSFEYGYHYLERNFALLQAAENYAKTAEQIWLDDNPNYWMPFTNLDLELVGKNNTGNQLNPHMYSYPNKGDENNNYVGGANPAELAWYFLVASIDSGFGYYDENVDDGVKPTISMNQSLHFSKPYVNAKLSKDKTGPSVWWPQRWPYNPGSVNKDKSEGWSLQYFDTNFGIYTYAYDVNDIADIKVKIREHKYNWTEITAKDKTYKLYDPQAHSSDPDVDPSRVGAWVEYAMIERDLKPDMNGVPWQVSSTEMFQKVPAQEIGNLFYTYIGPEHGNGDYQDVILDYYIEAVDTKGNVTKSPIQQVYVGQGRYKSEGGKIVEDANGDIAGTYPFVTDKEPLPPQRTIKLYVESTTNATVEVQYNTQEEGWSSIETMTALTIEPKYKERTLIFNSVIDEASIRYRVNGGSWKPNNSGVTLASGTWTIYSNGSVQAGGPEGITYSLTLYYKGNNTHIHWRETDGTWTSAPGDAMVNSEVSGYLKAVLDLGMTPSAEVCFNTNGADWDANGGSNYSISAGTFTFDFGTITEGKPTSVTTYDYTVYFETDLSSSIEYITKGSTWSSSVSMSDSGISGYTKAIFSSEENPVDIKINSSINANIAEGTWTIASNGSKTSGTPSAKAEYDYTIYLESVLNNAEINYDYSSELSKTDSLTSSEVNGYDKVLIKSRFSSIDISFAGSNGSVPNSGTINVDSGIWAIEGDGTKAPGVPDAKAGKTIKLYYKKGFSTAYIHYRPVGGSWTSAPGVQMSDSSISGYKEITIDLGSSSGLEFVINDGGANWDNNNSNNYLINYSAPGIYTFDGGNITEGEPTEEPQKMMTIYYKGNFGNAHMHYRPIGGNWTSAPGVAMNSSSFAGYTELTVDLGSASGIEACFNDGGANWDANNGSNYVMSYGNGKSTVTNGVITAGEPNVGPIEGITIYIQKPATWNIPTMYAYSESGSQTTVHSAGWPGTVMTSEGNGWYSVTLEGVDSARVIFTNAGNDQRPGPGQPGFLRSGDSWYIADDNSWNDTAPY